MNRAKKHKAPRYSEAQATKWLSWLAKNMQRHDQAVFLIEGLQPGWLARKNYIRLHLWISICASILLCGLSGSLFGGLLGSLIDNLFVALLGGLIFGSILGLALSVIFTFGENNKIKTVEELSWSWAGLKKNYKKGFKTGFSRGFIGGLLGSLLIVLLGSQLDVLLSGLIDRVLYSLLESSIGGLFGGLAGKLLVKFFGGMIDLLFGGLFTGLLGGLIVSLFGGLFGSLLGVILSGLERKISAIKTVPNQGIHSTIRSAIKGFIGGSFLAGVPSGLLDGLFGGLVGGLLYSPIGGLLGGLWLGGMDVIRHYTLRLLIYLRSYGPWNYAKFLDYAVDELHFMQRVGGGYIFIHRMLLEHFAAMEEEVSGKAKPEEVPVAEGP